MSDSEFEGIVVVGAGLVGSLAALTLARKGYRVKVFEYRPDFRNKEVESKFDGSNPLKKSINLALSYRGQKALENVGLLGEAMKMVVPMFGRAIHLKKTIPNSDYYADMVQRYDEMNLNNHNNSIEREGLVFLLLKELEKLPNVSILFGNKLLRIQKDGIAVFENQNDHKVTKIRGRLLLGCDGAYSVTRQCIMRYNFTNFHQIYIPHGYKEFSILPKGNGNSEYKLPQHNYLHIWPRGDFMMIALPNSDKTFTCTLFAPMQALTLETNTEIEAYFADNFPEFLSLIPDLVDQYKTNPASRLVSIKVDNWLYNIPSSNNSVLLLGDAAHACVPFYGQGMNCGFEDVLELDLIFESLKNSKVSPVEVITEAASQFNSKRILDAQTCGELSYHNYKEMRDHTQSSLFLFVKKIEGMLNYIFGDKFIPQYKMVSFTRIPYSEIVERNAKQQRIIKLGLGAVIGLGFANMAFWGYKVLKPR